MVIFLIDQENFRRASSAFQQLDGTLYTGGEWSAMAERGKERRAAVVSERFRQLN